MNPINTPVGNQYAPLQASEITAFASACTLNMVDFRSLKGAPLVPLAQAKPRTILSFGAFELDTNSAELRKRGHRILLQQQPYQILLLLLESPGEVVTREEICAKLWDTETFVDFDRSLNKAMVKLRQALGDDADSPRFVETLPRRGYRFLVPVERRGDEPTPVVEKEIAPKIEPPPPSPDRFAFVRSWRLAAAVLGACAIPLLLWLLVGGFGPGSGRPITVRSLAVLPFENLSGDPGQDYFAEGMTDELNTNLVRIRSLRVVSRTSMLQYLHTHKPIPEIARELNVDAVIEGSVVRSGDKVRITTQLIDAHRDVHLWAQSYERKMDDILEVQDSIALDIASQVRATLSPRERDYFAINRAPIRPNAYDDYLRGRSELSKQNVDAILKATEYFQRAIEDDPQYARAYGGMAEAYGLLANYQALPPSEAFPKAKAAALKALSLDPDSPEAHSALALVKHHFDWDWAGAEVEYKRALALQPNFATAHHRYAWFLSDSGRHEEALGEIRQAQKLDPTSIVVQTSLGRVLYRARRYEEAIVELRKGVEMDQNRIFSHIFLGMAYEQKGMCTEALGEFRLVQTLAEGRDNPGTAHVYATCGQLVQARRAMKVLAGPSKDRVESWFYIAAVFAVLGENDRAFDWLNKAVRNRDFFLTEMAAHPYMDPLRSDPRFKKLLREIRFPQNALPLTPVPGVRSGSATLVNPPSSPEPVSTPANQ
jgi:TolB-like protein/DNA-binding winged helix-turn-helix (wHTH) protein/Tfp pilus assembly protein PilF